jgi:hypothetical protein
MAMALTLSNIPESVKACHELGKHLVFVSPITSKVEGFVPVIHCNLLTKKRKEKTPA